MIPRRAAMFHVLVVPAILYTLKAAIVLACDIAPPDVLPIFSHSSRVLPGRSSSDLSWVYR